MYDPVINQEQTTAMTNHNHNEVKSHFTVQIAEPNENMLSYVSAKLLELTDGRMAQSTGVG